MTHIDPETGGETGRRPTAAELFAGVGGFHLALDRAGFDVVWSNQWEPATRAQHAFECYVRHVRDGDFQTYGRRERGIPTRSESLGLTPHEAVNEDIAKILDKFEAEVNAVGRRAAFSTIPTSTSLSVGFLARTTRSLARCDRPMGWSARRASSGGKSTGCSG